MTANNRWLILAIGAVVVLCACLACVAAGAVVYFWPVSVVSQGTTEIELSGYYTSGFEVSSFVPCEDPDTPGYGAGYWLSAEAGSGFYEQYSAIAETVSPPPGGYVTVFTRFRCQISPPGNYGHLGAYSHEVTVQEVLEMSLDGVCP